jgi:hypothetical protein
MMNFATTTIVAAGMLGVLAAAPQQDPQDSGRNQRERSLPSSAEVVMKTFRPRYVDAEELYIATSNMLHNRIMITQAETGETIQRLTVQLLGDTLLLYDLPASLERNLAILRQVDEDHGAAREDPKVTMEYEPRYLSLNSISQSLRPFMNLGKAPNYHVVERRGVMVLSDTRETVDEMLKFLARVDVAPAQVLLTCYLVRAGEADGGAATVLPAELVAGMRSLTGIDSFHASAMGMVRSSVAPHGSISILLDAGDNETFELYLDTAAFDKTTRTLSLSEVTLRTRQSDRYGSQATLFQTSTAVESGEYTVLGATGKDPLFVVLQSKPLTP